MQPDENTCVSRVEVAVSEALRVVATAMCTRLASSADFKVLRAALARRRPHAGGSTVDSEDDAAASDDDAAAANDDDDDDRGSVSAAATRSLRASIPGSPAPQLPPGSRPATTNADDVDVEFPEGETPADVTAVAGGGAGTSASASPRPTAVDGAAVARISQQIPRAVAVALGLIPGTAAPKSRGSAGALTASQLPSATSDDDDLPLDAAGILSPALFEALELLVPVASVAPGGGARGSDDPAPSAGLPAPTQGGLAAALRGLAESAVIRGAMMGIRTVIASAFAAATSYAASFQQYRQIVVTDVHTLRRLTKPLLAAQSVTTIGAALTALTAQVALCEDAPESRPISQLLRVESAQLKAAVRPAPRACLDALAHLLPQVALERAATLLTELMAANSRLRVDFRSVDEFVSLTTALQDVQVRREARGTRPPQRRSRTGALFPRLLVRRAAWTVSSTVTSGSRT